MDVFAGVNHARLLAYVTRFVGRDEAEDVVADAYLKAFRATPTFRNESLVSTWVYAIARRCAMDVLRRRQRRPKTNPIDDAPESVLAVKDGIERMEIEQDVQRLLARLPVHQREALVALAWHGKGRQAATALGIKYATLKSRVHRARAALRGLR